MTTFERVYTDEQRDAAVSAYLDRGIRPQRRIVELAAAGELTHRGETIEPFKLNAYTLRDMLVHERKRRAGRVIGETAKRTHADAVDILRARMLNLVDTTMAFEEKLKPEKRDPERMRQIARALREAASLPGKGEGRSTAPGQRNAEGKMESGQTTGMGASLLYAARNKPAPEPETQPPKEAAEGAAQPTVDGGESREDAVPDPSQAQVARPAWALTHA